MRNLCVAIALLVSLKLSAQLASYPTCQSNAYGWQIDKIWNTEQNTLVKISVCQGVSQTFWFNPGMYIEDASGFGKRLLISCDNAVPETRYTLEPNEVYTFTLTFQRIPDQWTTIDIREPYTPGATSWYWTDIALGNQPPTQTDKMRNFLAKDGQDIMSALAHPFTKFRFCRYCIDGDKVWLGLHYDGVFTGLEFQKRGNIFTCLGVIDDDFIPPFVSLELLRNWIIKQDNAKEVISDYEKELRMKFSAMTRKDLAAIAMSIVWLTQS